MIIVLVEVGVEPSAVAKVKEASRLGREAFGAGKNLVDNPYVTASP